MMTTATMVSLRCQLWTFAGREKFGEPNNSNFSLVYGKLIEGSTYSDLPSRRVMVKS